MKQKHSFWCSRTKVLNNVYWSSKIASLLNWLPTTNHVSSLWQNLIGLLTEKKRWQKILFFVFVWHWKKMRFCGKSPMQVNWKLINSKVTRWVSVDKLWKSRNSSHLFAKLIWYFNGDLSFYLVPKLVFSYNTTAVM